MMPLAYRYILILYEEHSCAPFSTFARFPCRCGPVDAGNQVVEIQRRSGQMDWREEYREKGFIIVDNVLPHALIDAHLGQVTALLYSHGVVDAKSFAMLSPERDDELMNAMLELHRRAPASRQLVEHRVIRAIVRQLFNAEPVVSMARSALWESGDMRAHVDTAFRSPEPPYSVCRIWCALEDIHPDSGCFYLVPGTHRTLTPHLCREVLDERPDLQALFEAAEADPRNWFRLHGRGWSYVSAKVADRISPPARVSPRLEKGDIIIFNPTVAHGTLPRTNPLLTRKMTVCEWTVDVGAVSKSRKSPAVPHVVEREFSRSNLIDITPILAERATAR
jgi:ectoine hydroxylase-related dioxygenase (phytanoyl-CoA dioxygenase family)